MKQARYIMLISKDYKSWLENIITFKRRHAVSSLDAKLTSCWFVALYLHNMYESIHWFSHLTLDNKMKKCISQNVKLIL